jgi:cell division septal protein FtsQ
VSRAALVIGERAHPGDLASYARRRPRPRARRRHWLLAATCLLIAAACAAGTAWILRSDRFAVVRVETGPYRFTDAADLQDALRSCLGQHLVTLDTGAVSARLTALPWVRNAAVGRRWPATLLVDLHEWRPVASVAPESVGGRADLVLREDGRLVPLPARLVPPALPVLVGFACEQREDGIWQLGELQRQSVLDLLTAVEATGLEEASAVDFLLAGAEGYDILLQEGRGRLLVGKEDFHRRLQKYLAARDRIPPGGLVDLRYRDRVSVRPSAS